MTLLESLTFTDWLIVAVGCLLIILIPSLAIAGFVTMAERLIRLLKRCGRSAREDRR